MKQTRCWIHVLIVVMLSCFGAACSVRGESDNEATDKVSDALCSSASLTSDDPDYTAQPGQVVHWTASSTCSGTAEYQFWLRNPATNSWDLGQDWSASSAFTWDTTGQPVGAWNVQAWVRDTGSGSYSTYGSSGFTLVNQAACTAASSTITPASGTGSIGTQVTFTNSASTCTSAEYQIVHNAPGSSVYTIDSPYSAANATYTWDSSGAALGTHYFEIWVRAQGSTAPYQTYTSKTFTVTSGPSCTGVTTAVSPASGTAGTHFLLTNTATTCTAAEYQIIHQAPGGGYNIDSAYSSANAMYTWDSTGAALGSHYFEIWVRAQGSTASYQAYTSKNITILAGAACSSATLSFSPTTHASVGTSVALSATATGCPSPTFRFMYQAPSGGAWVDVSPYTSSSTVSWNTTLLGAGDYSFQVWARGAGSPADYEAYGSGVYTLDASTPTSSLAIGGAFQANCELLPSGKVGCWGYNARGELGNASVATGGISKTPVAVTGVTTGVALGVGYAHACAVLAQGSVKCWGGNYHGQLGNGSTTDSSTPVSVSGIASAAAIASGNSHSCVALADGTVRCWGYNSQGQLGDGTSSDHTTSVLVSGISTARNVSAGYYHSCALLADGTVKCWGQNTGGALGNGTGVNSFTPVTVSGLTGVIALSSGSGNSCAVKSDGTIWCWGGNSQYGSLGSGSTAIQFSPVQIPGVSTATSVAVGAYHGCASLQNGTGICWGSNSQGELGNASTTDSSTPVAVSNLNTIKSVGISEQSSCAILTDGTASCWGYGTAGQLGDGLAKNSTVGVVVSAVP